MFCRRDFVYFVCFRFLDFLAWLVLEVQWVRVWIFDSLSL